MIESRRMRGAGHKANLEVTICGYSFFFIGHLVGLEYLGDLNVNGRAFEKQNVWVFMFMVPCIILYSMNNQLMQLYAVNFIPLLGSLYLFRVFLHPSSGVQF